MREALRASSTTARVQAGHVPSSLVLGGRRVEIQRPRARSTDGHELRMNPEARLVRGRWFDAGPLVRALPEVARVRFEQTLCAEYPQLRDHMLLLENEMSQHTPDTLATIWRVSMKESAEIAYRLVDVGFFKAAGTHRAPRFLLPPLYQRALKVKRSH